MQIVKIKSESDSPTKKISKKWYHTQFGQRGPSCGFPPKWRPARGLHSLRPGKIKTVWPQIIEIMQNLTHKCRKSIQNDMIE